MVEEQKVVRASATVRAPAERIFGLVADPARQPEWDGNDNLARADAGQRVRALGDVFVMVLTKDHMERYNRVVEFEEGRRIAWRPSEPGQEEPGHLWRWELRPLGGGATEVVHTYDWSELTDERRFPRARATTPDRLRASIERLSVVAGRVPGPGGTMRT